MLIQPGEHSRKATKRQDHRQEAPQDQGQLEGPVLFAAQAEQPKKAAHRRRQPDIHRFLPEIGIAPVIAVGGVAEQVGHQQGQDLPGIEAVAQGVLQPHLSSALGVEHVFQRGPQLR